MFNNTSISYVMFFLTFSAIPPVDRGNTANTSGTDKSSVCII